MREFNLLNYKGLNKGAVIKLHFYAVAFSAISRGQTTVTPIDRRKMMVAAALTTGVIPRRSKPQICSGRVFRRPTKKKVTAISSRLRVNTSRPAPRIEVRMLGKLT
jgi:hypothetical protein